MIRILALAVLLLLPLALAAQEPAGVPKSVAPYLDEQTVAVVRLDLRRVDADAVVSKLATLGKLDKEEHAKLKGKLETMTKQLGDAGAQELFVVFSLSDVLVQEPFLVVPHTEGATPALREALRPLNLDKIGSAVVGGNKATLRRLRTMKPAELPELAKGFANTGNAAVQAVVVLPPPLRRSLEETLPNLPAELGGGSIRTLTRGFRWLSVAVDPPPQLALRLHAQAAGADEAKALDKLVGSVFSAAGKVSQLQDSMRMLELLRPRLDGDRLTLTLGDKELSEGLVPALAKVRESAARTQSTNNLKQIGLALHNYLDVHKTFPAHASYDKQNRPLLSWRVHILPYVDANELYKQFRLDEPWDSEHNKKLIARMPAVFRDPLSKAGANRTTYLAPVGKDTVFPPGTTGTRIQDITDGTSNTFFVVQSNDDSAVIWTKPDDLKFDPKEPLRGLVTKDRDWFLAAFADGSVRTIMRTIDLATLRALFTRNGGEALGSFD